MQVRALSSLSNITDNFRPVQSLNGRRVFLHQTTPNYVAGYNGTMEDPTGAAMHVLASLVSVLAALFLSSACRL